MTTKEHTNLVTISHHLLWLRKKHGYSQKDMARLLKIGVGSLRRSEQGEILPRLTVGTLFGIQTHFRLHRL